MKRGRSGRLAGLHLRQGQEGGAPTHSLSPKPLPRDVRVRPPQPRRLHRNPRAEARGAARGPAGGLRGPSAERGRGARGPRPGGSRGCGAPGPGPGTSSGAGRPPPLTPAPPPGERAARISLSLPRGASGATPEAAAATHHITDGGDVSDSH